MLQTRRSSAVRISGGPIKQRQLQPIDFEQGAASNPLQVAVQPRLDHCRHTIRRKRETSERRSRASTGVAIVDSCAHGVDSNSRDYAREKETGDANPDRKSARQRLSWYDIAIANRKAGDECEIDGFADGPALKKANQQTQRKLKRRYYRQHWPREMEGMASGNEKASPYYFWREASHE
jgi:hypothetical protein